jgi:zinc transport system substrate-binding protein
MPKLKDINSSIKIINMSDVVRAQYPDREFSPGQRDPHIWLSLKRAIVMVECIAQELSSLDGKNSGTYRENASNYIRKLETLDKEIEESFKSLKNKAFIVYHPSLGYYADDYGLTMLAIQAEGKDATPDDLQKVINDAWKFGIKTVFFQAEIDSRHSEVIAEEIDGKAVEISPLSPDYIDSLKEITASIISSN